MTLACCALSAIKSVVFSALLVSSVGRLSRRPSCNAVRSRNCGGKAATATSPSERW